MTRLFHISFFVVLGFCLIAQNKKQCELRFDGIYATELYAGLKGDSIISLLRFYEDSTVITMVIMPNDLDSTPTFIPITKAWTPDALETFNKEHIQANYRICRPIGNYKIINKKIYFNIKTKLTMKIKYTGDIINRETLEMTRYNTKTKNKSKDTYHFIPYKNNSR